ncbi:hypothetical protein AMTR_s00047p00222630, partial [Amborella trichopoda]
DKKQGEGGVCGVSLERGGGHQVLCVSVALHDNACAFVRHEGLQMHDLLYSCSCGYGCMKQVRGSPGATWIHRTAAGDSVWHAAARGYGAKHPESQHLLSGQHSVSSSK